MDAIKTLTEEIQIAAATADEAGRKELLDSLRDLQYSIEKPEDTMQRVIHLHLVIAITRTAIDLKIFNILGDSDGPIGLRDLASRTGADPALLGRILRMLSSLGMIKETGEDRFASSQTSKNLSIAEIQAGLYHNYDVLGPAYQALPDFLASTNYQTPTETHKAAFQKAWNTDLPLWSWFQSRPKETAQFNRFMIAQRSSTPNAFNFFPIEEECKNWPAEKPLFVDIGGASGQQSIEFRKRFPAIKGRVIFQDLPGEIEHAVSQGLPDGVEAMVHDFYTPQVIKDAKFYYLRAILHDHLDDKAILILKNIMQVMEKDSLILLDEMVLPNYNVDWFATQTDLTMLAAFGSMERTEAQWKSLLDSVGLKLYLYQHRNLSDVANAVLDRFGGKKPIISGRDFAGTVIQAPSDPQLEGSEVYGTSGRELSLSIDGTHAEYIAVPVEGLSIKPKCLSWTQASAVGVPYSTAYLLLEKAAARAGDVVLIFGARGAVGKAAVELANAKGLKTITTSRVDGADVNLTSDENLKNVLDLNNGRGPSIILDCAGSPVLMEKGLAILGKFGRYVFVSGMGEGGPEVKINVMKMLAMDQSLHGVNSWSLTLAETKNIMDQLGEMFEDREIKGPEEESLTKTKLTDAVEAYQEVAKFDGKKFVVAMQD